MANKLSHVALHIRYLLTYLHEALHIRYTTVAGPALVFTVPPLASLSTSVRWYSQQSGPDTSPPSLSHSSPHRHQPRNNSTQFATAKLLPDRGKFCQYQHQSSCNCIVIFGGQLLHILPKWRKFAEKYFTDLFLFI